MLNNFSRKLEISANILIVAVALLFGYVLFQKAFLNNSQTKAPSFELTAGTKIALQDVDFQANGKTLLLALQKGCTYCSASMPFYKTLMEKAPEKGVKFVGVLPDAHEEALGYLKEHGVILPEIRQAELDSVNVRGTPTLILIDQNGDVLHSWVGKLSPERESEVISQL